jgi:hypothetical protein
LSEERAGRNVRVPVRRYVQILTGRQSRFDCQSALDDLQAVAEARFPKGEVVQEALRVAVSHQLTAVNAPAWTEPATRLGR